MHGFRFRVTGSPLAAVLLAAGLGCARAPAYPWRAPTKPLAWPLPPSAPRVRYEGTITAGQALHFARRSGFWLLDFIFGAPEIKLTSPHGLAADSETLAITDSATAWVHLLQLTKHRYRVVRAAGKTPLRCPVGVATDRSGGVFVTDSALARAFHFSGDGKLLGEVKETFVRPTGIAYDPERQLLHIVDTGAHAVLTFQRSGESFALARRLGRRGDAAGDFNFPTHATLDKDGNLYVADSLNYRVKVFAPDGKLLDSFGQAGDGVGDFAKMKGVAVDSEGHIYAVDSYFDVVLVFQRTGRCLLVFGGSGRSEGTLWLPTGLCIDEKDRIYVADSGNARIQVYQLLREGS